jgi:hypothetical protein
LKAAQEATRLIGAKNVNIALDARTANNGKFGKIPAEQTWTLSPSKNSAFVYFCDNETVDGVEFPSFPKILESDDRIVVADMSSNFLSRKVDVSKYSVIFVRILPVTKFCFRVSELMDSREVPRKTLVSLVFPSSSSKSRFCLPRHLHRHRLFFIG